MNKKTTKAIVLRRIDYGDYDRIITVLTPGLGRITLIAKGVRKINSKLAGGIELFSIFDAGFVIGKGEVGRLTSARLDEYYSNIVNDINRVQLGYEILNIFNRSIEDYPESAYFYLLCQLLRLLNRDDISLTKLTIYFKSRLLMMGGHSPNMVTDESNKALLENARYSFSPVSMSLISEHDGNLSASHIKLMRLLFSKDQAEKIFKVSNSNKEEEAIKPLIDAMFRAYL